MTIPNQDRKPEPQKGEPIRSGDTRAFDRLYAELAPRVLGYVMRLTGRDRSAAEDLVQETFLAAYAARETYAGRSQPLAWLLGIARRRWRDGRRAWAPDCTDIDAYTEILPASGEGMPERTVRAVTLEQAMAGLEPAMREALELVVLQELTYREAASVTGEPIGTVKWRVHQATRALRKTLDETEASNNRTDDSTRNHEEPKGRPDAANATMRHNRTGADRAAYGG